MKHLSMIQIEFLKEARKPRPKSCKGCSKSSLSCIMSDCPKKKGWDHMSLEDQREYLKKHPNSKKRLTAK
jgi:hypothetical protein